MAGGNKGRFHLKEINPTPYSPIVLLNNDLESTDTNIEDVSNNTNNDTTNNKNKTGSWCVNVTITDPVIVQGDNMGKYILWNVRFTVCNGNVISIKKRYSDFVVLYKIMKKHYGDKHIINSLPGKSTLLEDRFSGEFLERRRSGLEYWLNSIVLDKELGFYPEVKAFVLKH